MLQVAYPFRKEAFGGIAYNRYSTRGGYIYLNSSAYSLLKLIDNNSLVLEDFSSTAEVLLYVKNLLELGFIKEADTKRKMERGSNTFTFMSNRLSSPTSVDIYPSFTCNYRCGFCFVGELVENNDKKILSENNITKFIDSVNNSGVFHVGILGGEPLYYRHIEALIGALYKEGIHISLATNGTNSKTSIINKIIECDVDINISVQGHNEEIHGNIVKNSSSFSKAQNFIKALKSLNKSFLISLVVNPQNYKHINEYIEWCASVGATDVTLFFPERSAYTVKNNMVFSFKDFIATLKKAKQQGEKYGIKVDSNCHFDFLLEENLIQFDNSNPLSEFLYGDKAFNSRIDVMPSGEAYPNHEFFGMSNYMLGNVLEISISQLWSGSIFNKMYEISTSIPKLCLECRFQNICKGGFLSRKMKNGTSCEKPDYCPLINESLTFEEINHLYSRL